jgi:hypothetical protein
MSDWIRLAFVSRHEPAPSPILALNYFSEVLEDLLCEAIPKMPEGSPGCSLATFVAECVRSIRDPRCVELWNLAVDCRQQTEQEHWPGDHQIWDHVDLLVDVDRWVIHESTGQRPIPGADSQSRFDPERFDCWPRRIARLISLFIRNRTNRPDL